MKKSWFLVAAGMAASLLAGWVIRGAEIDKAKDLLAADKVFAQASGEKGLEAWLVVMAPNVRVFPGDAIVEGFDKVKALYERDKFDPKPLQWVPVGAEVSASGDMGYTWGHFEGHSKDANGNPVVTKGRYMTIWRKQPNGDWKVVLDAGANEPADAVDCCRLSGAK